MCSPLSGEIVSERTASEATGTIGGDNGVKATPAQHNVYGLELGEVKQLEAMVSDFRKKAKIGKLADGTIAEYTRRNDQLKGGVDVGAACKNEKYLFKAAGEWGYKKRMAELFKEADKARSAKGIMDAVRLLAWKNKVAEMMALEREWDAFRGQKVWADKPEFVVRKQASHKKARATDEQLEAFHAAPATKKTIYREHFLVAEFCGARPEEFGGYGITVETIKYQGETTIKFWIEGAKQKGGVNGQPLRTVLVPFPKEASKEVQRRWNELARRAAREPGAKLILCVEATEGGMTAGAKLSRAFSNCAGKVEGKKLSMYSLRNRFSSQAKDSNDHPEDVAVLLGHQSTETQRHYAAARRGKTGVSPVKVINDGSGKLAPVRSCRDKKNLVGLPTPQAPKISDDWKI